MNDARHPRLPLTLLLILSSSTIAGAQNTPAAGGSAGTSYTIRCRANEVMTGIRVNSGMWIDRITPRCAMGSDIAGGGWDSNRLHATSAGKAHFGNTEKSFGCPSGYAVKKFMARYGSYVNSLVLTCQRLGRSWRTTSSSQQLALAGASGGSSSKTYECAGASHAIGMHGKAGEYVDSFGLLCGNILPGTPAAQAPVNGLKVTSKRPTFYFQRGQQSLDHTLCLNLTSNADCAAAGTIKAEIDFISDSWTPSEDLPFRGGDRVYWSVNACNDNGCRRATAYFTF